MYVTLRVSVSLAHKCVILRPVFSVSTLGQAEILHNCSQERAHTLQNVPYHFTIEMHFVSVPPPHRPKGGHVVSLTTVLGSLGQEH